MHKFQIFKKEIAKTNDKLYVLSGAEHAHSPKFLSKLNRIFLAGSESGIFPADILDVQRNLHANLDDLIHQGSISESLRDLIDFYEIQLGYFAPRLNDLLVFEDRCVYAMQAALVLFRNNRLTHGRLANLFIDINDSDNDAWGQSIASDQIIEEDTEAEEMSSHVVVVDEMTSSLDVEPLRPQDLKKIMKLQKN